MKSKLIYALSALMMVVMLFATSCEKDDPIEPKPPVKEQTYSVTFNANGGAGTMTAQEVTKDKSTALKANAYTYAEHTFSGWNTKSDGSGTSYADKSSVKLTANLTLYAQWIADAATTYTVTYDANGGEGTMDEQIVEEDKETVLTTNAFTRADHTFTEWNSKSDGSGTSYADKSKVTLTADLTLYAQWKETPTGLFLANIDADNIPEGDTWVIEDADATAYLTTQFYGLGAALEACDASRTITIEFPNLTKITKSAFYGFGNKESAKYKVIANKVTSGESGLRSATNLVEAQLENLTSIGDSYFENAFNLTAITIAKNSRITSIGRAFFNLKTKDISVTTHSSNAMGLYVEAEDCSYEGPFKSVNGVVTQPPFTFADDARIFVEGETGSQVSYILEESGRATLYIANYWSQEPYNNHSTRWRSSNDDVIRVLSSEGSKMKIMAMAKGKSTITALDSKGNELTIDVYVGEPFTFADDAGIRVKGINGTPESYTLPSLNSTTLSIARYWDMERYDYPNTQWSTSDPSVVSISNKVGSEVVITAGRGGNSTITATDDMGNELKIEIFVPGLSKIGDFYYSDNTFSTKLDKSKTVIGVIVETDGTSGKVISLDQASNFWSTSDDYISGGTSSTNGRINMNTILKRGNNADYKAFIWVHNKNKGATADTYTDDVKYVWYLPAYSELLNGDFRKDAELNKVNTAIEAAGGKQLEAYAVLWTSTQQTTNVAYAVPVPYHIGSKTILKASYNDTRAFLAF